MNGGIHLQRKRSENIKEKLKKEKYKTKIEINEEINLKRLKRFKFIKAL